MGRRGMVTIGVAVQAETFSNSNNSSPVPPNLDPASVFSSSSKSAIFLPPSKNGSPQTLKITFNYNKETNLPEIIVNLDGEENQEKYLELKELCRGNATGLETDSPSSNTDPLWEKSANDNKDEEDGKELQVYYFTNEIKMNSEKPVSCQEVDTPIDNSTGNASAEKKCNNSSENMSKQGPSILHKSGNGSEGQARAAGPSNVKVRKQKSNPEMRGRSQQESPNRRVSSPTKDINDKSKIPIIHSSATGFMPCEYYRQRLMQDLGCSDFNNPCWTPSYYAALHKTAGQKVVNKLATQQKHLEEQAAAQRKRTEFVFHEELGFCEVPEKIPLKKKQTRLEPLRTVPRCY